MTAAVDAAEGSPRTSPLRVGAGLGGIVLSRRFWARLDGIDNVIAIKVAPFNRYRTLDRTRENDLRA